MQRRRFVYPPPVTELSASSEAAQHLVAGSEVAMRNQLTIVKGYSQLLRRHLRDPVVDLERASTYSITLSREVETFERLLVQYLAASRLQWNLATIDIHAVDVGQLVTRVASRFDSSEPPWQSHSLRIDTRDHLQGIWDYYWVGEAIAAVISNALTYSPDGSEVHVVIRQHDDHAVLTVTDTGLGIFPDEQQLIFTPFVRGRAARKRNATGWGLGLFIASRAILAHGGWIEVESAPGAGSQFEVHIPLLPPASGLAS